MENESNIETFLILYSGGVDSNVLLKYCLEKTKNPLKVIYIELGYNEFVKTRITEQNKAVEKCINHFKKNYREFNFDTIKPDINISEFDDEGTDINWGDDQWCAFFAGKICQTTQIKKVLIGHFTYNSLMGILHSQRVDFWYYDNSLIDIFKSQIYWNKNEFHYIFPHTYLGTGIDELKTKLDAWNYLDEELQRNLRVCESEVFHCGKCRKCSHLLYYNIRT